MRDDTGRMPALLLDNSNFSSPEKLGSKLPFLSMNLLREQRPYEFIAPKHAPWFRPILNALTRLSLRMQHKVESVDIVGGDTVSKLETAGHSILVTPNHADHADPELMMTVGREEATPSTSWPREKASRRARSTAL